MDTLVKWEDACLSPHKNKRSVRTASHSRSGVRSIQVVLKRGENMNHLLMEHLGAILYKIFFNV